MRLWKQRDLATIRLRSRRLKRRRSISSEMPAARVAVRIRSVPHLISSPTRRVKSIALKHVRCPRSAKRNGNGGWRTEASDLDGRGQSTLQGGDAEVLC